MLRWGWVAVRTLDFMHKEHCFFWIYLRAFSRQWEQSIWFKVYLVPACLLLPPWAQVTDVLLAFPPHSVVLSSEPPNFLVSSGHFTLFLLHLFVWFSGMTHSFLLLLSSHEFHVLLLISLMHTNSLQLWHRWLLLSLSVAGPRSDVWIQLVTESLFALCKYIQRTGVYNFIITWNIPVLFCLSHPRRISDLRAFWLLFPPLSSISSSISVCSSFLFFVIDSFAPPVLHFIHLPTSPLWSDSHVHFLHFCCWNVKHPSRKIEGLCQLLPSPSYSLFFTSIISPRWWNKYSLAVILKLVKLAYSLLFLFHVMM